MCHKTKHFQVYARFEVLTMVRSHFSQYDAVPVSKQLLIFCRTLSSTLPGFRQSILKSHCHKTSILIYTTFCLENITKEGLLWGMKLNHSFICCLFNNTLTISDKHSVNWWNSVAVISAMLTYNCTVYNFLYFIDLQSQ